MKHCLAKTSLVILDNKWHVYFCDGQKYNKIGPDGSRAYTAVKRKAIYFNCDVYFPKDKVVLHELAHAYAEELMGHDLAFGEVDVEEFWCTLIEQRGHEMIKKSASLTKQFRRIVSKQRKKRPTKCEEDDE